ncbi:beta-ketoacyl-[acyl-carrier-protein] synthase family protein [Brevibacterium moorei]|uniref:beta-ketoacyl-[acyl-carrier-protein] synthase family protein n=1 Tax=Brevibacterium moorei TaxID=2968457 RepID=UPI00211C63D1|nr:beta-ketoacyl-[acyl-carrier-protein] synthase family protein [Brevibacterium sp. 68QC2CO]MCQ9387019.1 beta-ketoacyl-[acyl-carrier-protein] synthase family protein [Brevibacterium sp. 68QC2CO]
MREDQMLQVAITGRGVISSLGNTIGEFNAGLDRGKSTAVHAPWADEAGGNLFYAPVREFDPSNWLDERTARGTDRFAQYAVAAATNALADAGIDEPDPLRTAVVMGTSMAGAQTLYDADAAYREGGFAAVPRKVQLMAWPNMAAGQTALRWRLHGPLLTVSTACASSLDAIGIAARMIEAGLADTAIVGGTDNGQAKISGMAAAQYGMSPTDVADPTKICMPFDVHRRGVIPGDGAGVIVLENLAHAEKRGARVHGIVRGYASLSDGYHPSSPDPSGKWEVETIRAAQIDAEIAPSEIGAVVAHGTGTPVGDISEIIAINELFPPEVAVTSLKGTLGHTAGAAGVMGVIAGLHTMDSGTLAPTANTTELEPEVSFRVPLGSPSAVTGDAFQVNAFGFGGQNASLVVTRA